jgi:hypothetical protein
MLDQSLRTAILELHKKGASVRSISDALGVSRDAVSDVIESGSAEVPHLERPELAEPWRDEILAQYASCKGNLVRVHEEVERQGAEPPSAAVMASAKSPRSPPAATTSLPVRRCSTTPRRTGSPSAALRSRSRSRRWSCASRG